MKSIYDSFIETLPGRSKFVQDISSNNEFMNKFGDLMPYDTVVLYTGDVWRPYQHDHIVRDHPQLQGKKVFVLTLDYENRRIGDQCYVLSFPYWYLRRQLPRNRDFIAKPRGLTYGYGSLKIDPHIIDYYWDMHCIKVDCWTG